MSKVAKASLAIAIAIGYALASRSPYYADLAIYAVILSLLALSVNVTTGFLGYISFGHAAFFGLGAYTTALLYAQAVNFWLAMVLSIVPGLVSGALVGFGSLRLGGPYFAIATLTFAEILRIVSLNWDSLTRGPLGIIVPAPKIAAMEAMGIAFHQYYLALTLLVLALVAVMLRRLLGSPIGRAWHVIREAPQLAESLGIATLRYRVMNASLSGAIAALAGALIVPRLLLVSPDLFGVNFSATGLLAVFLGGRGTLLGPILGGAIFAVFPEMLRFVDDYRLAIFAAILLLSIRVMPNGLVKLFSALAPRRPAKAPAPRKLPVPVSHLDDSAGASLQVLSLSKSFGGLRALKEVSFAIAEGEVLGLIGPNGAGKTTCLTTISGFQSPSRGDVRFCGRSIVGRAPHLNAADGLVRTFQHTSICPTLTAYENVLIGAHLMRPRSAWSAVIRSRTFRAHEISRAERAEACLRFAGIDALANKQAGAMAYGEQRMLSIAVALAAGPRMLLLDEPAAGLNHTEAERLTHVLRDLRRAGITIAIIDHNLRMMMSLCDRIVVLHHGEMIAAGTPAEVSRNPLVITAYLGEKRSTLKADPCDA